MMMEESEKPFNLDRLLNYTKTIYPYDCGKEKCLLPFEILKNVDQQLENIVFDYKNLITDFMINGLKDFFKSLAQKIGILLQ